MKRCVTPDEDETPASPVFKSKRRRSKTENKKTDDSSVNESEIDKSIVGETSKLDQAKEEEAEKSLAESVANKEENLVEFKSLSELLATKPCEYLGVGCPLLNSTLGGGLRRGEVTEVVGESSSGKTQFSLTACVEAASRGETVLYIVTEGAFPSSRLDQIVRARDRADIRDRILVKRVQHCDQLMTVLTSEMKTVFGDNDNISLVIIDSVAAVIRYDADVGSGVERAGLIHRLGQAVLDTALQYNVAVIAVNQVTDVVEERSHVPYMCGRKHVASLGAAWAQYPHTRLWLTKTRYQVQSSAIRLRTLTVDWSCRLGHSTVHWYVDTKGGHGANIID